MLPNQENHEVILEIVRRIYCGSDFRYNIFALLLAYIKVYQEEILKISKFTNLVLFLIEFWVGKHFNHVNE